MKIVIGFTSLLLLCLQVSIRADDTCQTSNGIKPYCGVASPEDMAAVAQTPTSLLAI